MWLINDKCTSETGRQLFSTASTSYTSAELPAESASNTLDYGGRVQIKGDWSSEKFTVGNVSLEKQTFCEYEDGGGRKGVDVDKWVQRGHPCLSVL